MVRARNGEQKAVKRPTIMLQAATGASKTGIANELNPRRWMVRIWHYRFAANGSEGLLDKPRIGRPSTYKPAD